MTKLASVQRMRGPICWYLAEDHLLAADQSFFERHYRRFYYEDLRAIVMWPNGQLWWRLAIEVAVGGLIGWLVWALQGHTAAAVIWMATAAGMGLDGALGPRTSARIETVHGIFLGTLAPRWRKSAAVLRSIEARLPRRGA